MKNNSLTILFILAIIVSLTITNFLNEVRVTNDSAQPIKEPAKEKTVFSLPKLAEIAPIEPIPLFDEVSSSSEVEFLANLKFPFLELPKISYKLSPQAEIVLITDLNKDIDLFGKAIYRPWPIASLVKLMTAVVSLENFEPEKEIIISKQAVMTHGQRGGFSPGERYRLDDLVNIMLLTSSNDAAYALKQGLDNFVALMNEKARKIGMEQTKFVDSTGLSYLNISTASDLKKLVFYLRKNHPQVLELGKKDFLEMGNKKFSNINKLREIEDFFGGKTGYIDESRQNALSLFNFPFSDDKFLIIVLGATDRVEETEKLFSWLKILKLIESLND